MDRLYYLTHSHIDFHFAQTPRDFVVDEIPLYEFSGEGEHLILHIRKKGLSTWEMLDIVSQYSGVKVRDIGYAGMKDKKALTSQYISIPKKYESEVVKIDGVKELKILNQTYHNNKLRTGHLKGNRFFIRLKKVNAIEVSKLVNALEMIKSYGMPNYFGYQRFGKDGDNFKLGRELLDGIKKERNYKKREFLINAYQSHLFNLWLSERVKLSKIVDSFSDSEISSIYNINRESVKALKAQNHPFKLLNGDIAHHYPYGKIFFVEDLALESERFVNKGVVPTGLLVGMKAKRATDFAGVIEKDFDEEIKVVDGSRRFAWIFPENITYNYKESEAWFELGFELPKGSYATVLLEELAHRSLKDSFEESVD